MVTLLAGKLTKGWRLLAVVGLAALLIMTSSIGGAGEKI